LQHSQQSQLSAQSNASAQSNDIDEHLIMAIMERPPLFDHRIDVRERSKLKKNAL